MKKRVLTVFLALVMCMGLAVPAFARQALPTQEEVEKMFSLSYKMGGSVFQPIDNGNFDGEHVSVKKELHVSLADGDTATAQAYVAVASGTTFTVKNAGTKDDGGYISIYLTPYINYGSGVYEEDILGVETLTQSGFCDAISAQFAGPAITLYAGQSAEFELPKVTAHTDDVIYALELRLYYPTFNHTYTTGMTIYKVDDAAVTTYLAEHAPSTPAFTDVPAGQWYADPVAWAVENEITNGTGGGLFSPGQDCTQEQILTFLYRAARGGNTAASAEDMTAAVNWAREKGMIDDSFNGKTPCTRATAVSYIWQALGKSSAGSSSFSDVPANAPYAAAVDWAVEIGVTDGTGNGQFSPGRVCDRGTIATFLHRAYVPKARLK